MLLADLVESSRRRPAASPSAADTILRAAAQLLFPKLGTPGAGGRLPWNEHRLARGSATATRVGREERIDMRQ
jgi:hypothetical protein